MQRLGPATMAFEYVRSAMRTLERQPDLLLAEVEEGRRLPAQTSRNQLFMTCGCGPV
jgi:hypothetical protein